MSIKQHQFWGLTPLIVFLLTYFLGSLLMQDFYAMPLSLAFVVSSVYGIIITEGLKLEDRIKIFTEGASNTNILSMIWIFVLAGAFASSAKAIGAIDATVHTLLYLFPSSWLLPSLFMASCLISLSIGTSVGTIVALMPIALGFAEELGISSTFMSGLIVGGAFFGDNLSFISDTTIAATRTQGVSMSDKFRVNILIVLPAAIACLIFYTVSGLNLETVQESSSISIGLMLPYILVIALALMGKNVLFVLLSGIVCSGIVGLALSSVSLNDWITSLGSGITGMGELIIVTLLSAGMLALIRYNGGIDYLLGLLSKHIKGKRGGELSIALLVVVANICTANNTIAILSTGDVAKEISQRYHIDSRRTASLLDTFSCVAQGFLPYGAQLLLAAGFASVSPLSIVSSLYYPMLLGVCSLGAIFFRYPRKYSL